MRTHFLIVLALIITCSCRTEIPEQNWHKGNLHTHSLWSDGDDFPEMIIKWYKEHNYQFVAISDHNTIASGVYWYKLKEREIKNKTLEKYQQAFGDWVEIKDAPDSTSVRLKTFEEYRSKLEEPGIFKVIRSEEVTSSYQKKPVHINVTNIQHFIEPVQGNSVVDVMQQTLDQVHAQRKETNTPMFAHINHPNFGYGITAEDFKKLNGERFFEVYNGHPAVFNNGDDSHISTEEMWDAINISYYQQGKPLLFGIATDDSHNYHSQSSKLSNSGRGWVMVASDRLTTNSLIEAMEAGNFYASSGISLKTVFYNKKNYTIEIIPETDVSYEVIFYVYKKNAESVVEFSRLHGTTAKYNFEKDDIFVRAKIISNQKMPNPIKVGETMKAWTQPVLIH
jgi:hypothetical protein